MASTHPCLAQTEFLFASIILQNDINALFDYGNSWHLFFNNIKCAHLHFHFNPTDTPTYYISNMEISKN